MKRSYIVLLMLLFSLALQAQHSSNAYRNLADSLYRNHHYQIAADYYVKALKKAPQPGDIMLQVAKCYEKVNNVPTASEWYGKARANGASFSNRDTYEYAQTLMMLNRRADASALLEKLVVSDPNDLQARQLFDDVTHFQKYYKDSAQAVVKSLAINTPVSEFAPAFYQDGIVFTSATAEKSSKKKYHWDNSYFLSLLYSKVNGETIDKPQLFEKASDSRYHDGPATFYDGDNRMIVNRNQPSKVAGQEDTYLWHIALFDAKRTTDKSGWELSALPFDQPPYSFAHPAISENGNVLFFISDKPGGYGGTDIYRSVRSNGVWSKPYNLGPVVNTSENEVFPFYTGDVLYFASNGHGGLGGLDVFKSTFSVNGFEPPVNLGYPVNSIRDDFSFITRPDQHSGFLASARNGNDDLFSYRLLAGMMNVIARITDGDSNEPLAGATVQIITASGDDITATSDEAGNFSFKLPEGTAYMIIGKKDDKVGMISGFTDPKESQTTQELSLRSDKSEVMCVVNVMSESGSDARPDNIRIVDETNGKELKFFDEHSLISFSGERNHRYRIVIENENGDTTSRALSVSPETTESLRVNMVLKNATFLMAARVYNAETQAALGGAQVKVVTFADADQELVADGDGIVTFALPVDAAYIVIASRDNLTGMHSGVATRGSDKDNIVHPVPAHGDAPPPQPVLMVALVTHNDGDVAKNVNATVTEKATGKTIEVTINDGVLNFYGDREKEYIITATDKGHAQIQEEVLVPRDAGAIEKISIVLEKNPVVQHVMAVRVINAADQKNIPGAEVRVVSFTSPDTVLIANSEGVAEFLLADGTTYMVIGSKDRFTGMHTGIADADQDKTHFIHPVPARSENDNVVPVAGLVTGEDGQTLATAKVTVTETSTGKVVTSAVKNGLVMFEAEKGKGYSVRVAHDDHQAVTKDIVVPSQSDDVHKVTFTMRAKRPAPVRKEPVTPTAPIAAPSVLTMSVRVFKETDQSVLGGAQIKIISFTEPEKEVIADDNGIATFVLPDGDTYMVIGSKDGFTGMHSGMVGREMDQQHIVHPVAARGDLANTSMIILMVADENGKPVRDAQIFATDVETGKEVSAEIKNGIVSFHGEHGRAYRIAATAAGRESKEQAINVAKGNDVQSERMVLKRIRPSAAKADVSANLVIVNTDTGDARFYVNTSGTFAEIIEKDGALFLQNENESRLLGNGRLSQLKSDPRPVTESLGITPDHIVELRNIYFDYDKSTINADATTALETVHQLLTDYPSLKLVINAHADDRGRDTYNLNLSRRRAKAVRGHLIRAGLSKERLFMDAFGESKPAVLCESKDCSEDEHRRNRRAEFALSSRERTVTERRATPSPASMSARYQTVLQQYGHVEKSGIVFKVTLGAYRYNDNLTFDQLKSLGTVEKMAVGGITYYYLSGFTTLNRAEEIRRQVNAQGVTDAYVSIFNNGERITMVEFVALAERP